MTDTPAPRGRTRGGTTAAQTGGGAATGGGVPAYAQRGQAGINRSREVKQQQTEERKNRQDVGGYVRRFRLKQGEQADIIILDDKIADIWFMHEHFIPGPGNNIATSEEVICPQDYEACPVCELAESGGKNSRFRRAYYMFAVTVLNLTGYWSDAKQKQIAPVKELLVVKSANHDEFLSIMQACENRHSTIRGMELTLRRGTGDTSPATGVPVINPQDGQMFALNSEEVIVRDFDHEEVKNEAGEVVRKAHYLIRKFPYDKVFAKPDTDAMRRKYGGSAPMGSQGDHEREWGGDGAASAGTTSRVRGGGTPQPDAPAATEGQGRTRTRVTPAATQTTTPPAEGQGRTRTRAAPAMANDLDDEIPF